MSDDTDCLEIEDEADKEEDDRELTREDTLFDELAARRVLVGRFTSFLRALKTLFTEEEDVLETFCTRPTDAKPSSACEKMVKAITERMAYF
jgi:hypothetical protein